MASTNTLEVAAKPKTEQNQPITDSLNSTAAANVFKKEVAKITATDIQGRAKALLKAVNKALAAAGIPPIRKIEVSRLSGGDHGRYLSGSSTMKITDTILRGKNLSSEAIAAVYHEAVHHKQAYNVARYLAASNTANAIKVGTGIDSNLVDKAVKSTKDSIKTKNQLPLTQSQLQMAQNIYKSLYDRTNIIPYERINEKGVRETKNYQYSAAYYQYLKDATANIDLINKNPGKYRQEEINQAVAVYRDAYAKYRALPQEQEAFTAQELVQPTKQGVLKTSSQNTKQTAEATNGDSGTQIAAASNAGYQAMNSTQESSIQSETSSASNNSDPTIDSSSQNHSNSQTNDATDLSKVVALLRNNAADVKQQYGLDVTTDAGLGKAVMQYWKENNLDPKTLKEQLPNLKDSELKIASTALLKTNTTETTKAKQLAIQK
jgi:hypothetical protein